MTMQIFCKAETKTGIVICYTQETGTWEIAGKCCSQPNMNTFKSYLTCVNCGHIYPGKQIEYAISEFATKWYLHISAEINSHIQRTIAEWIAGWTGIPQEDIEVSG